MEKQLVPADVLLPYYELVDDSPSWLLVDDSSNVNDLTKPHYYLTNEMLLNAKRRNETTSAFHVNVFRDANFLTRSW